MKESQLSPAWDEGVARWDSRARTLSAGDGRNLPK